MLSCGLREDVVLILKYIYFTYIRKYLIVGSEFNDRVALIQKYIYWAIYMEVFSLLLSNILLLLLIQPRDQTFISCIYNYGVGLK
jgi:hypothetical protein